MSHYHAVVWLDHNEAHIMHVSPDDVETSVVKPAEPHRNLQRKRGSVSGSRQPEDQHFYHEVVEAMSGAKEVLIVGPGHAKLELIKHIHAHDPKVADQVIGVETVDHPSDAQVVAFARKYFVAKDRMLTQ
jgi:stalled ribosome rescue protein Dom34